MSAMPVLVDSRGHPLSAAPHQGAERSAEFMNWNPTLRSPDAEILGDWETLASRTRDLIRNHGLTSGAVQSHLDAIIGPNLRLSAMPDWRALGQTPDWAADWARTTEAAFRNWASDLDFAPDAARGLDLTGILQTSYRQFLSTGDIFCMGAWRREPGYRYATCVQILESEIVCNPGDAEDSKTIRGGIELDAYSAAIAYHVRQAHPNDHWADQGRYAWVRVPRRMATGRTQMIHIFNRERPSQTRGKSGFTAVISKLKSLERFEKATLQAAILNAMYAATIESPLQTNDLAAALGAVQTTPTLEYMDERAAWHKASRIRYDGVQIPHLYPGEKLTLTTPQHPKADFSSFENSVLRHLAAGLNMSYEELSRDYSKSNYSSARAGMLNSYRFFFGQRHKVSAAQASQIYALWLEEAIALGDVVVPDGAPSFAQAKSAWCRCKWLGPGRPHIDPDRESKADERKLRNGITTWEAVCAEDGEDWEDVLTQQARERKLMRQLGMDPDRMLGVNANTPQQPQSPPENDPADDPDAEETEAEV